MQRRDRVGLLVSCRLPAVFCRFFFFTQLLKPSGDTVGNRPCRSLLLFGLFPKCLHYSPSIVDKVSSTPWLFLQGLKYPLRADQKISNIPSRIFTADLHRNQHFLFIFLEVQFSHLFLLKISMQQINLKTIICSSIFALLARFRIMRQAFSAIAANNSLKVELVGGGGLPRCGSWTTVKRLPNQIWTPPNTWTPLNTSLNLCTDITVDSIEYRMAQPPLFAPFQETEQYVKIVTKTEIRKCNQYS